MNPSSGSQIDAEWFLGLVVGRRWWWGGSGAAIKRISQSSFRRSESLSVDSHLVDLCRIHSRAPHSWCTTTSQGSVWKWPLTQFLDPSVGLVLTYYPCFISNIPIPFIFLFSSVSVWYLTIALTLWVHDPYPQCADSLGTSSSAANTCVFIAFQDDSLTMLSNSNFVVFIVLQISLLSCSAFPPVSVSKGVYSG